LSSSPLLSPPLLLPIRKVLDVLPQGLAIDPLHSRGAVFSLSRPSPAAGASPFFSLRELVQAGAEIGFLLLKDRRDVTSLFPCGQGWTASTGLAGPLLPSPFSEWLRWWSAERMDTFLSGRDAPDPPVPFLSSRPRWPCRLPFARRAVEGGRTGFFGSSWFCAGRNSPFFFLPQKLGQIHDRTCCILFLFLRFGCRWRKEHASASGHGSPFLSRPTCRRAKHDRHPLLFPFPPPLSSKDGK